MKTNGLDEGDRTEGSPALPSRRINPNVKFAHDDGKIDLLARMLRQGDPLAEPPAGSSAMRRLLRHGSSLLLVWAALLGISAAALQETVRPGGPTPSLPAVAPDADALARIRRTGVLRVGSTGDYDPFSVVDPGGAFRGIDAEAAHLLARAIGPNVHVRFVKTSWPAMTADLLGGKFDVAMGGVSRNKDRSDAGVLTRTYLIDAKVALIRATDREKYRTLADLDRAGVTVLVNPGGTNQQFVEARLRNAKVVVVRDNLAIPGMIAEGKGDVMVTDGVEAKLNARRDPRLCVALTDPPLARIEKVYYLRRGQTALLEIVNAWIGKMQADGSYARLWAKCVGE
jgi:cyclohexadienyl dehydratase